MEFLSCRLISKLFARISRVQKRRAKSLLSQSLNKYKIKLMQPTSRLFFGMKILSFKTMISNKLTNTSNAESYKFTLILKIQETLQLNEWKDP